MQTGEVLDVSSEVNKALLELSNQREAVWHAASGLPEGEWKDHGIAEVEHHPDTGMGMESLDVRMLNTVLVSLVRNLSLPGGPVVRTSVTGGYKEVVEWDEQEEQAQRVEHAPKLVREAVDQLLRLVEG